MPLHDWTRLPAYAFHDFHLSWLLRISTAVNAGGAVASGYGSRVEPVTPGRPYSLVRPRNRLAVRRNHDARVVAVLEVVSPEDKATGRRFAAVVNRLVRAIDAGVNVLLVDPFPPGRRNPAGIHGAIWPELGGDPFTPTADKPLALAAYEAGDESARCYVEPLAAGDRLADMPLFLEAGEYVNVPLEATYQAAFATVLPQDKAALEPGGRLP